MAVDEFVSIHERIGNLISKLLDGGNLGVFYFAWVIPGIALVFIIALLFFRF